MRTSARDKKIHRRQRARQDLVDIFRYFAPETGIEVADRFLAKAESAFNRLSVMPGIGTLYDHQHPELADVRYSPISGFRKYLVFYRPVIDGIQIIRVVHGARDIDGVLKDEFTLDDDVDDDS